MRAPLPIPVTPAVLSWARHESGYGVDQVAKRLAVKNESVQAWESGAKPPTFKQIEKLAQVYHRPLSLFFVEQPPRIPPLSAEHRRLPGVHVGEESPELRLAMRRASTRRENAINLLEELGEPVPW